MNESNEFSIERSDDAKSGRRRGEEQGAASAEDHQPVVGGDVVAHLRLPTGRPAALPSVSVQPRKQRHGQGVSARVFAGAMLHGPDGHAPFGHRHCAENVESDR